MTKFLILPQIEDKILVLFMGYTFFSSLKISNKNILKNILEI